MRKEIAQEAYRYMQQYCRGKQLNPGYDDDLYQRLVVQRGLSKMFKNGEYGYMTDIIFAARRLQRPVMVINRSGKECFTVDSQGTVLQSLNTLADASRLPRNTIIMVWDRTEANNPGSDHFMLVKR
ncbi:hypothetical protein [Endozoicomonas atrinae]|nr:hypothetical protein [Endozoicomonas atrinae]